MTQIVTLSAMASGMAHLGHLSVEGSIPIALFAAGLVGSVGHCVGMCGPFVLAQTHQRLSRVPASRLRGFHRVGAGGLVPYHVGRLTTYVALGAVAASLTGRLSQVAGLQWLAALLLLLAALWFLAHGLRRWLPRRGGAETALSRLLARAARPFAANPTGLRGYALGVVLGFLPCGLLYGALAAAASTMDAGAGAAAMGAFALGTVPALVAVGCLGDFALRRWPAMARTVAPALMVVNAGLLGAAALSWVV